MDAVEAQLRLTESNARVLGEIARQAGRDVAKYVDESVSLGLDLAEAAIQAAPRIIYILFQRSPDAYERHEVKFEKDERPPLSNELIALDTQVTSTDVQPLPLDPDLLSRATDMAALLAVERTSFVEVSIFFRWMWGITRGLGGEILLEEGEGDYNVLDTEVFEEG